jgi:hypothetical protein
MCQLSFRWQLMRCKHLDTCNDTFLDPESSHVGRGVPKFTVVKAFHVLQFCNLVEQKQLCCNPPCCDNVMRRITMDAASTCAVCSMSFLLVAKDGPISVMGNQFRLKLILRQNVP